MRKPQVLVFADYYLPGFLGGGPLRSIANLVESLQDEFDFSIVTRDRDLATLVPFEGVKGKEWHRVGAARVCYLTPWQTNPFSVYRLMRSAHYDVLYLNSLFSPRFSLTPLAITRLTRRSLAVLIAPRGELFLGALQVKRWRKAAFLRMARALNLYRAVVFHASTIDERDVILAAFHREKVLVSPVLVAPDLALSGSVNAQRTAKSAGRLRLVTVARVARNKNIAGAIELLAGVLGEVALDIYGPREDESYWAECEAAMDKLPRNVSVRYCGILKPTETAAKIAEYDAFFLPTHGENFGHSIVEALNAGCPVVISDRTPWRLLEERAAGWAIRLNAPDRFREVITQLATMDEREHAMWRAGARAYAVSILDDRTAVDENRALFRTVIASVLVRKPLRPSPRMSES
jgi:glycosyltransferase involved in cell wall biosynthesis